MRQAYFHVFNQTTIDSGIQTTQQPHSQRLQVVHHIQLRYLRTVNCAELNNKIPQLLSLLPYIIDSISDRIQQHFVRCLNLLKLNQVFKSRRLLINEQQGPFNPQVLHGLASS